MKINVEYPLTETVKPNASTRQVTDYTIMSIIMPINRAYRVNVKTNKLIDLDAICMAQTGMLPSDYQAKFKQAWNA